MNTKKKICVGIDPGLHTGVAILENNKIKKLKTTDFWGTIQIINQYKESDCELTVYIENPSGNKPIFPHRISQKNYRQSLRIAQNVGMNKQSSQLLINFLEINKINYTATIPNKKSLTKLSKKEIKNIFGYDGRSSEHSRDALCLLRGLVNIKKGKK